MTTVAYETVFTPAKLAEIFPPERADQYFEALFGDASEGAFDIALEYVGEQDGELRFRFRLDQRPGQCLRCNLTQGLPQVFSRHPIIDVAGTVRSIERLAGLDEGSLDWSLGSTEQPSAETHAIPLLLKKA
ncbi:hypothetical protein [Desulfohalovibrio reitneri]|uniref:hypothetical protein n=1 Tax=Desulfohalovibrio reitneri TaxID=1307759 RepID=UPI0004A745B9|nr:hypothetical protein [Desulfohalovibrio reitneri]